MENKNQKQLESFIAYCKAYPDQRFWQALRNWSGYAMIYGSDMAPTPKEKEASNFTKQLTDTFYE
jgi:hypothetical protein